MNLIKTDIQSILPDLTWEDFTLEGDVYVTKTHLRLTTKTNETVIFVYEISIRPTMLLLLSLNYQKVRLCNLMTTCN